MESKEPGVASGTNTAKASHKESKCKERMGK